MAITTRKLVNTHKPIEVGHFPLFPERAASRLANAVRRTRKAQKPIDIDKWIGHFKSLCKQYPEGVITRVLDWYIFNMGKEDVPNIFTAKVFKDRFSYLLTLAGDAPDAVEVSEEAHKIARELLLSCDWPKGSALQVPSVVQRSLTNYDQFRRKLVLLLEHMKKRLRQTLEDAGTSQVLRLSNEKRPGAVRLQKLIYFTNYLINNSCKLMTAKVFVDEWMRLVNTRISRWESWDGKLGRFVFTVKHPTFQSRGATWAQEYDGRPRLWIDLMEEYN